DKTCTSSASATTESASMSCSYRMSSGCSTAAMLVSITKERGSGSRCARRSSSFTAGASGPSRHLAREPRSSSSCQGSSTPAEMAAAPFGVLRPDDVVTAAEAAAAALGSSTARDWTVPAGTLEWDVRSTLAHAAGATAKYALCLASGTSRFIALRSEQYADATNDDLLHALVSTARALRQVAVAVPD